MVFVGAALACAEVRVIVHELDPVQPLDLFETQLVLASQPHTCSLDQRRRCSPSEPLKSSPRRMLLAHIELDAFVEEARRERLLVWAAVERRQRACRTHRPLTAEGSADATEVLHRIDGDPAAPASGGRGLPEAPQRGADPSYLAGFEPREPLVLRRNGCHVPTGGMVSLLSISRFLCDAAQTDARRCATLPRQADRRQT